MAGHGYSAGSQGGHYGANHSHYNSSQSSYGGAEGRHSYHGHGQKYQPRQQYQVKKSGGAGSASSAASAQAKGSDGKTYNGGGKNGRSKDLDVRVKPFRLEKAPETSSKKAETASTPAAQDSKSVSTSSVKSIVRLKYEMCKNFRETGSCKYGDRCLFAHGDHELINRAPPAVVA